MMMMSPVELELQV